MLRSFSVLLLCLAAAVVYADDNAFKDPATGMELVSVKGGCYGMGDAFGDGGNEEKPVHEVCVDDFYIGRYEVTQGQWKAVMGNNPAYFRSGDDYPVEKVNWNDSQEFIKKLNKKTKKNYRLPTEAEWEYAAREGGRKVRFGTGKDNIGPDTANFDASPQFKTPYSKPGEARGKTSKTGSFSPNGLGLYDMSGNVLEWVQDWYGEDYYKQSPKDNPTGPASGRARVLRGGSWDDDPGGVRASARRGVDPQRTSDTAGFRIVINLSGDKAAAEKPTDISKKKPAKKEAASVAHKHAPAAEEPAAPPETTTETVKEEPPVRKAPTASAAVAEMEFVSVNAGCYEMGDIFGGGEIDEMPVHEVCVRDFSIGKYEVTQGQWKEVMGNNPSFFKECGDNCPVEQVSWEDVREFIGKLSQKTGGKYRLPTEAEWEYAARKAGSIEKWAGTNKDAELDSYAWFGNNSGHKTNPVGEKKPNGLGLCDMSGNVLEWVQDWYGEGYYSASPRLNPAGPASGKYRVLRGGSFDSKPRFMRTTLRVWALPQARENYYGLRLVQAAK